MPENGLHSDYYDANDNASENNADEYEMMRIRRSNANRKRRPRMMMKMEKLKI